MKHTSKKDFSFREMYDSLFEDPTDEAGDEILIEKGIEVDFAQGMSSKRKRKKFKSQAAYEKWLDKMEGDIEVFATRPLDEKRSYADLSDEKLKKLHGQMKDEQLSPVAAQQFRMIVKAMKDRGLSLKEKSYVIRSQGKGESKSYRIMTSSGSELIDMEFDSEDAAKKHAKKKGLKLTEALSNKKIHADVIDIANQALKKVKFLWGKPTDKGVGEALESLKRHMEDFLKGYKSLHVEEAVKSSIEIEILKLDKALEEGTGKTYLKKSVIDALIKSGKWEVEYGDAKGKSGSSLTLKSHTGKKRNVIIEGSTEDALGTLKAIIGSLEKRKDPDQKTKDMLKMGRGIKSHYDKEKSFSPDQASWIFKMSKMFK